MGKKNGAIAISREELREMLKEERAAAKAELLEEMRTAGQLGNGLPADSLGDICAAYIRDNLDNVPPALVRADARTIRTYVPIILDLPFSYQDKETTLRHVRCLDFTEEMRDAWQKKLAVTPKQQKGGKSDYYAPTTVNRIVSTLQTILTARVGKKRNPMSGIPREDVEDSGRVGYFRDEAEFEDFMRCCRPLLADMWRLVVVSGGMRKGEARLLTTDEVNWENATIEFEKKVTKFAARTKNKRRRMFPVREEEMEMLRRRKALVEQLPPCAMVDREGKLCCPLTVRLNKGPHWHLFADPDRPEASPLHDKRVQDWVVEAREAWIDPATGKPKKLQGGEAPVFHHGRHTWATWYLGKGGDFREMVREGGWLTDKVALRYGKQSEEVIARSRAIHRKRITEVRAQAKAEAEAMEKARKAAKAA